VLKLAFVASCVGDALLKLGVQAARRVGAGVELVVGGSRPLSSANSRKTIRIITVTAPR